MRRYFEWLHIDRLHIDRLVDPIMEHPVTPYVLGALMVLVIALSLLTFPLAFVADGIYWQQVCQKQCGEIPARDEVGSSRECFCNKNWVKVEVR